MKRKRFVKILMSIGYDRNSANLEAKWARSEGSYEKYYKKHVAFRINIDSAMKKVHDAICKAADCIRIAFKMA